MKGEFDELRPPIKHLGPWHGANEGEITKVDFPTALSWLSQGFVVVYKHISQFNPES